MRNHYIPQFIIRQFADSEGFVYVYAKKAKKVVKLTPKDVFVVNNLYDDDVERLFAKVESRISQTLTPVLESCRNGANPNVPVPEILGCCRYVAMLQLGRTRFAKEIAIRAVGRGLTDAELKQRLVEGGFSIEDLDRARQLERKELARLKGRGKASAAYRQLMLKLIVNPADVYPDVARAVAAKGVVLGSTDSAFVLGDRGAVSTARTERPLDHPLSEVYFPVSPNIAFVDSRTEGPDLVPEDRSERYPKGQSIDDGAQRLDRESLGAAVAVVGESEVVTNDGQTAHQVAIGPRRKNSAKVQFGRALFRRSRRTGRTAGIVWRLVRVRWKERYGNGSHNEWGAARSVGGAVARL